MTRKRLALITGITGPLVADYSKARRVLKWRPKVKFRKLVAMLVDSNIARLK